MLRVCLILHGVVPRPKNSPPDCFLNGLSNPLLTKKLRETSLRIFLLISWRRARDFCRLASLVATRQTLHRRVCSLRESPRCSNPFLISTNKKRTDTVKVSVPFSWRRARDSNPRTVLGGYTISNRAPSTSSDNSPYLSNNY